MNFTSTCAFRNCSGQNGTLEDDHLEGVVLESTGTHVFYGITRGDWSGTNAGGYDWAALKVDAQGDILWKWQVA